MHIYVHCIYFLSKIRKPKPSYNYVYILNVYVHILYVRSTNDIFATYLHIIYYMAPLKSHNPSSNKITQHVPPPKKVWITRGLILQKPFTRWDT